jgi:hypothetical protein
VSGLVPGKLFKLLISAWENDNTPKNANRSTFISRAKNGLSKINVRDASEIRSLND